MFCQGHWFVLYIDQCIHAHVPCSVKEWQTCAVHWHFTVYVTVLRICQTFDKDIQSESRLMNKAVLGVEYYFLCNCFFIHKINVQWENISSMIFLGLLPAEICDKFSICTSAKMWSC